MILSLSVWRGTQFAWLTSDDQLQKTNARTIIKYQGVIGMLKRPLDPLNVKGSFANVYSVVLRILNTKSESGSFVPTFPSATFLGEIAFPYTDTNIFIIEKCAVEFKEVNQMFA